jgi:hypothetical protein
VRSCALGDLLNKRNIAVRDVSNEIPVRLVQHDMEMLDGVYGFERLPVLEPDDLYFLADGK